VRNERALVNIVSKKNRASLSSHPPQSEIEWLPNYEI